LARQGEYNMLDNDDDEVLEAYLCGEVTNLKEIRRGKAKTEVFFTYAGKNYSGDVTYEPTEEKDSEGNWKIYYHVVNNHNIKEVK
jgi:hypothetical protein